MDEKLCPGIQPPPPPLEIFTPPPLPLSGKACICLQQTKGFQTKVLNG